MEEIKKEVNTIEGNQPEAPAKEANVNEIMRNVEELINSKIVSLFGDVLKEINKPREVKQEPKEKTIQELKF